MGIDFSQFTGSRSSKFSVLRDDPEKQVPKKMEILDDWWDKFNEAKNVKGETKTWHACSNWGMMQLLCRNICQAPVETFTCEFGLF